MSILPTFSLSTFQTASATNDRRAVECAATITDGGTYSVSGTVGTISSECASTFGDQVTYSATSCPGCTVTVDGKTTFLEPPTSLGCSREDINAANPCVTSSSTTTTTEESSTTSTSTSTSTGSTEYESKCIINGSEVPCDEVPTMVTANTNKGTSGGEGAKTASVTAMLILSSVVALT